MNSFSVTADALERNVGSSPFASLSDPIDRATQSRPMTDDTGVPARCDALSQRPTDLTYQADASPKTPATPAAPPPDALASQRPQVEAFLRLLIVAGQFFEFRALDYVDPCDQEPHPRILAGVYHYDHIDQAVDEIVRVADHAAGIYVTVNPVDSSCFADALNTASVRCKDELVTDQDILARRFLVVDVAPSLPKGMSSTDAEKDAAFERATKVHAFLQEQEWPEPICVDSGGGFQFLYRVDLATDDDQVVHRVLKRLSRRFTDHSVEISTTVANRAYNIRMGGTIVREGLGTMQRPHRVVEIVESPDVLLPVAYDQLVDIGEKPVLVSERMASQSAAPTARNAKSRNGRKKTPSVQEQAWAYATDLAEKVPGKSGRDYTAGLARDVVIGHGLDTDTAFLNLRAWNESKCDPLWSDDELWHMVEDAEQAAQAKPSDLEKLLNLAETDAARLVRLGKQLGELFHTAEPRHYAYVQEGDHYETRELRSQEYQRRLVGAFFDETGRTPGSENLKSALGVLELLANRGPQHEVYTRVGHAADPDRPGEAAFYVDLADDAWRAIKITSPGWTVDERPLIRFRRPNGLLALPTPVRGGSLAELRSFLNVADHEWVLVVGWLVGSLNPLNPYAVLAISGEQGSAKSTATRVLKALLDPHLNPLRTTPSEERDLVIAGSNSHLLAFDNLSYLSDWLSDAFCRVATGGGLSRRRNYTDDEEVHFTVRRPVIMNAIVDVATRNDLLDRMILLTLPRIEPARRRYEREFAAKFDDARPRILGALLDAVAKAMELLPSVEQELAEPPRMADFSVFAEAGCRAAGFEAGEFLRAYAANRELTGEIALDASPVATAVMNWVTGTPPPRLPWTSTPTELLAAVSKAVDEDTRRSALWPKTANKFSRELRRAAPSLRLAGISITTGQRQASRRTIVVSRHTEASQAVVPGEANAAR